MIVKTDCCRWIVCSSSREWGGAAGGRGTSLTVTAGKNLILKQTPTGFLNSDIDVVLE